MEISRPEFNDCLISVFSWIPKPPAQDEENAWSNQMKGAGNTKYKRLMKSNWSSLDHAARGIHDSPLVTLWIKMLYK